MCKESQICPHGRVKHTCKECGEVSVCAHGRQKLACQECGRRPQESTTGAAKKTSDNDESCESSTDESSAASSVAPQHMSMHRTAKMRRPLRMQPAESDDDEDASGSDSDWEPAQSDDDEDASGSDSDWESREGGMEKTQAAPGADRHGAQAPRPAVRTEGGAGLRDINVEYITLSSSEDDKPNVKARKIDPDTPVNNQKTFHNGERVLLLHLIARPELNDNFGIVQSYVRSSGRYSVLVDGLEVPLSLNPANLQKAAGPNGPVQQPSQKAASRPGNKPVRACEWLQVGVYARESVHMCLHILACMHGCMCACVYLHGCGCVDLCMCVRACACVHVCEKGSTPLQEVLYKYECCDLWLRGHSA